ncbi:MAG: hypothetical protein LRZ85_09295 [Alphaproteobacteria bacterium]|nr:hypothetical protein [Alphaproteobacteria bacterium]
MTTSTPPASLKQKTLAALPWAAAVTGLGGAAAINQTMPNTVDTNTAALGLAIAGLVASSKILGNAAEDFGNKTGMPGAALGVMLGFMSSVPELAVTINACLQGEAGLGIGNVTGSNIANPFLAMALPMMIFGMKVADGTIDNMSYDNRFMVGAGLMIPALAMADQFGLASMDMVNVMPGYAMLGLLGAYVYGKVKGWDKPKLALARPAPVKPVPAEPSPLPKDIEKSLIKRLEQLAAENEGKIAAADPVTNETFDALEKKLGTEIPAAERETYLQKYAGPLARMGIGAAGLIAAADLIVNNGTLAATGAGFDPTLVGTIAVAVGTSLPEIFINIDAFARKKYDQAFGNVLGSNVFNVLMIAGVAAVYLKADLPEAFQLLNEDGGVNLKGVVNDGFLIAATLYMGALAKNPAAASKYARLIGAAGVGAYAGFTGLSYVLGG